MSKATHYDASDNYIPCGIPSPGSRLQSVVGGLHPATIDSVLKTKDEKLVTCRKCRRWLAVRRFKEAEFRNRVNANIAKP